MAEGTSLAKAYVQILPSMEGFQGKLEEGLGGSGAAAGKSSGASFGDAFSAAAGVAIKASAAAITGAAAGITALTKSAVSAFGDYQQLAGGVEKIFDEADISGIIADANKAYKDLNMSANQYLAAINQTGASFAQTMGDQKGYDVARTGMKAIADYASGTGRNLDELNQKYAMITRSTGSYQSIADQFSGILPATSEGFLKQAQAAGILKDSYSKLTEVPIEEYQEAVTQMLKKGVTDMGLYDNTVNESLTTLQGSFAMTKSAWTNLVAGLANPDADIGELVKEFIDSAGAAADNLLPTIKTALEGAGQMVAELAPKIFGMIPELLNDALPDLMTAVNSTITTVIPALADGIAENLPFVISSTIDALQTALPKLYEAGKSIIGALFTAVSENLPEMLQVAMELVTALADDIGESLPKVLPQIAELIVEVAKTLTAPENLTPMVKAALGIIKGLADGLLEALPTLIQAVPQIINNIMALLTEQMPVLLSAGQEILVSLISGITENLPLLVQVAFDLIDSLVTFVLDNLPQLLELAAQLILALVQGITENLPKIAEGAGELIPKIIATVVDKLPEIIDTGFEITEELVKGILKALPKIVESVVQLIGSMCIKFTEYDWLSLGKNLILGIKDGVVQYAYELINAVTDAGEKAYNAVKDFFGIASPSKLMRDGIGAYLPAGIAEGIIDNENEVTDAMDELAGEAAKTNFTLPKIQGGGYQGDAYGGYYGQAKQPVTVQFVLPNGRVLAEWIEPDITNIQDTKVMIGQRGYAT